MKRAVTMVIKKVIRKMMKMTAMAWRMKNKPCLRNSKGKSSSEERKNCSNSK